MLTEKKTFKFKTRNRDNEGKNVPEEKGKRD